MWRTTSSSCISPSPGERCSATNWSRSDLSQRHSTDSASTAAELTIDSVTLLTAAAGPEALAHTTDDHCLWITLDRPHDPPDSLDIRIVYHGRPRTGLFFVNPDRNDPGAPREIYTQGEPEFNHYWFPCWDYPNDMATSETITTVPQGAGRRLERKTGECEARRRPGDLRLGRERPAQLLPAVACDRSMEKDRGQLQWKAGGLLRSQGRR